MELIALILGLSLIPSIMFWGILLGLIISTSIERSAEYGHGPITGGRSGRWFIFILGIILTGLYISTRGGSISETLISFKNYILWLPLFAYLGIGLLYSVLEFFLDTRKAAKYFADKWDKFNAGQTDVNPANQGIRGFLNIQNGNYHKDSKIIKLTSNLDFTAITPVVNPEVLSFHVTAWTLFWPFFLLSMLIGDVVLKSFKYLSALMIKISTVWVKSLFKNAFTPK